MSRKSDSAEVLPLHLPGSESLRFTWAKNLTTAIEPFPEAVKRKIRAENLSPAVALML